MNLKMNKIVGMLSIVALAGGAFAQAPAAAPEAVAPAEAPAASEATPAATPEAPAAAPAAEAVAETPAAEPQNTPVETAAPAAAPVEESAPVAVRGADAAAPVEEPAVMVAPKAVRGADGSANATVERPRSTTNTVYYETIYTREDGVPVRTVYVAQREGKDTVSMDKLMGLVPMEFKIGAHGSIGSYYLSSNEWDGDQYDGMNWRAGLMSILPLSEYTMGVKLGVLYEQSEASQSYYINGIPYSFKFKQKKIDIPVLFTFKAPSSRIYFDLGAQLSIPLYDKLKYTYTDIDGKKGSARIDMIDENFRNSVDWSFLFGFSVMVHKYVSLDVGADIGLSNLYSGHIKYLDLELSPASFNIGLTLYPF